MMLLLFWITLKLVNIMSTNIDQPGFPDTKILEALANQLFKATSIEEQVGAEKELLKYHSLQEQGSIADLNRAPVKISDTHPAPPSVGGIGASAGAINSVNAIDLRSKDQTYNANGNGNKFPGTANAAPSVAS